MYEKKHTCIETMVGGVYVYVSNMHKVLIVSRSVPFQNHISRMSREMMKIIKNHDFRVFLNFMKFNDPTNTGRTPQMGKGSLFRSETCVSNAFRNV